MTFVTNAHPRFTGALFLLLRRGLLTAGLLCVAAITTPRAARASSLTIVYQGSVGKYAIVMELPAHPTGADDDGRYFYASKRIDINLIGEVLKGGGLSLQEDNASNYFQIMPFAGGGWSGYWSNGKGKRLPVKLTPAALPPLPAGAPAAFVASRTKDPYAYLRLAGIHIKTGKLQTFMGYTLRWISDPDSEVTTFQVVKGYTAKERQGINQQLLSQFWSDAGTYYDCAGMQDNGMSGDYDQTITPTFMNTSVVSASSDVDADCGGAHPSHEHEPININVATGQLLDISDVLTPAVDAVTSHAVPPHAAAPATLSGTPASDSNTVLAHWLVSQFKELYPKQMATDKNDDCNYASADSWDPLYWYFTPKGLFVRPDGFAYVDIGCRENDDWSVIPYAVIAQHPGAVKLTLPH